MWEDLPVDVPRGERRRRTGHMVCRVCGESNGYSCIDKVCETICARSKNTFQNKVSIVYS